MGIYVVTLIMFETSDQTTIYLHNCNQWSQVNAFNHFLLEKKRQVKNMERKYFTSNEENGEQMDRNYINSSWDVLDEIISLLHQCFSVT